MKNEFNVFLIAEIKNGLTLSLLEEINNNRGQVEAIFSRDGYEYYHINFNEDALSAELTRRKIEASGNSAHLIKVSL